MTIQAARAAYHNDQTITEGNLRGIGAKPKLILDGTVYWDVADILKARTAAAKQSESKAAGE
jgi:hypothetical protein